VLLTLALETVRLSSSELTRLRRSDARKQAVAWLLRKYTTVRNRWIGERLAMGHERRVSQSVRAVADAEHGELLTLRRSLERTLKITD
jgi:hypothetical protein